MAMRSGRADRPIRRQGSPVQPRLLHYQSLALAESAAVPDGMDVPAGGAWDEDRLSAQGQASYREEPGRERPANRERLENAGRLFMAAKLRRSSHR